MTGQMAPLHAKKEPGSGGVRQAGDDAFKLTLAYLKQEALDPLKGLGRFLAWGLAGSLAIAVGILLVLVGILRLLQAETGTALTGDWSWVPYFAVSVLGLGVAGVAAWRITAGPAKPKLPKTPATPTLPATPTPTTPTSPTTLTTPADLPVGATAIAETSAAATKEGQS
jgi:hypothetical protein